MRNWLDAHGRTLAYALAAIAALCSLAIPAGLPARWAALAMVVLSLGALRRQLSSIMTQISRGRARDWRQLLSRWAPYGVVAVVTALALGPVCLGKMPISQDHANHYFFTHILVYDMIPSGQLFGWTDRVGIGYPFGDIHYTLCYFVTGLGTLVTFGLLPLQMSYAFGIVIVWLCSSLAVVALAKRLGASPWAAALAGAANAVDPGSDREGGWIYSMFHGVWPQQFGVAIWIFAILSLWRLTEKATTRQFALAVLLVGLGLLIHPMNALAFLIAGVVLLAVRLFAPGQGQNSAGERGVFRLFFALLLGALIGLLWIARMIVNSDAIFSRMVYWDQLPTLAEKTLTSSLLEHQLVFVALAAVVGAIAAWRGKRQFGLFAAMLAAVLLFVGAMDGVLSADLGLYEDFFRSIQYRRFSIPLKPLWFAFAGLGVTVIAEGIAGLTQKRARDGAISGMPLRIMGALIIAPLLYALWSALPALVPSPAARPLTVDRASERHNQAHLRRLLARESSRLPPWQTRRAVYWEKDGYGGRYPLIEMSDAGFGLLPTKFIPAQNFDQLSHTTRPATMAELGASMIISRWPVYHEAYQRIAQVGLHHIYESRELPTPPARIRGTGQAEVIAWGDKRRVIRVTGATPGTVLSLTMAPYRKWRPAWNGRKARLAVRRYGAVQQLELPTAEDGELILTYQDSTIELMCFGIGILVLFGCLVGLVLAPRRLPRWLPPSRMRIAYRAFSLAFVATLVLAGVKGVSMGRKAVSREWLIAEPLGSRVAAVLHRQGHSSFTITPRRFCVRPYTRDPSPGCSEGLLAPRLAPARSRRELIPSCLSVGVPPRGTSEVRFALPRSGTVLKGRFQSEQYRQSVSGQVLFKDPTEIMHDLGMSSYAGHPFRLPIPPGADEVGFVLSNSGAQPYRVCLEAVVLQPR